MSTKHYAAKVSIAGDLKSSFKNAFGGASSMVGKLKDEIGKLSRTRKDIEAFQRSSAKIDKFKDSLSKAQSKLADARKALADAEKPTAQLTRAVDLAENKVNSLTASLKKENEMLGTLTQKLGAAGVKTSQLAAHEARLQQQMEKRSKIIARQRRSEESFRSARGNLGSSAATLGIFAAGTIAAFAPMVKAAADFQTQMGEIQKTAGFSDNDAAGLKKTIEELVGPTNRGETLLLGSAQQMAAEGAALDQIKASLGEIARASVATNSTMEDLTKTSLAFQNNMKIAASESKAAFGIIATGSKAGSFEIQDMAKSLPKLLAQAGSLGMSGKGGLASVVAALEVARKGAGTNDEAANNVQNLLAKLNAPETVKRFKEKFGVDWEKESKRAVSKGIDPLIFALDKIQQVTKGDSFRVGELFGDMQVKNALIPLLSFRKEFDKIRTEALAGEDLIDIDFAKSVKSWPELITSIKNGGAQLLRMAGDELLPVVKDLVVSASVLINKIVTWRKENPKLFSTIVKGVAVITALVAGLLAFGLAVKGAMFAWSGLSLAFATFSTIAAGISAPFLAIAAVVVGVALAIRKYWAPISAFFKGVWTGITEGWKSAGGDKLWVEIKEGFAWASKSVSDFLKPLGITTEEFEKCFSSGKTFGEWIGITLATTLRTIMHPMQMFQELWPNLADKVESAFARMVKAAEPFFKVIDKLETFKKLSSTPLFDQSEIRGGQQIRRNGVPPGWNPNSIAPAPKKEDGSSSQINHFQINTQPGQSPEAISESVIRRLQQFQEQQNRGSLWDGGEFATV